MSRGKVKKVANSVKEFIAKQVFMVFFNLVLFEAILCCGECFSCLNKLLKWLCVSQKSSRQPWRYEAQTSFPSPPPPKKNLTEEVQSIHSFPVQVPSGYPDPKQEPRPHVSNTMLSPWKWQWKRTSTWRQNRTPPKAAFPKKLPLRSAEMFWAALLCEAHPTQSSGFLSLCDQSQKFIIV